MSTTSRTHSHRRIRYAVVAAMMTALPLGIVAAPANAEPVVATSHPWNMVEHPWQRECEHTGPWQWQHNHGNWEWNNCDNANGHWEWRGDHGHENWQWHRDRDAAPPPRLFGSY